MNDKPRLITPNEAIQEASNAMLDGRKPESAEDWIQVMNCIAYNMNPGVTEAICMLISSLYDVPLSEETIKAIAEYQISKRKRRM